MSRGWLLGGHWYVPAEDLIHRPDCSWHVVKQNGDEEPYLLQLWSPKPDDRALDQIRIAYLQRFAESEILDPPKALFGHNEHCAWFLQELAGTALREAWRSWNPESRARCLQKLQTDIKASHWPRLLEPSAIRLRPGRIQVPLVMGEPPLSWNDLQHSLCEMGEAGPEEGSRDWEKPIPLSDPTSAPLRGRSQEMTYLKSLVIGFSSHGMERVIVISGEEGLGHEAMVDWCCAVAETESFWLSRHTIEFQETARAFLSRLLQDLLSSFEADFYTRHPDTARLLSKNLASFAFLRDGRKLAPESGRLTPEELEAAVLVLRFAKEIQNRLLVFESLERAEQELQETLATLVVRSESHFIFSHLYGGKSEPEDFLKRIKGLPEVAYLSLNRLEERHLFEILSDMLGRADLPGEYRRALVKACLGNPGLLRSILELAQLNGILKWNQFQWELSSNNPSHIKVQEDLIQPILAGRLRKLDSSSLAIIRSLALMEWPLEIDTLGKAIGVAGDPLEEAVRNVQSAKLVHSQKGRLSLLSPKIQELALGDLLPGDIRRLARALLKALQEAAGRPILSVRLQSLASDEKSVLSQVMAAIEQEPPAPMEAEVFVRQAMELNPTPEQRSRLWEFLCDAWTSGNISGRTPLATLGERSCYEFALEALGLSKAALEESPERDPAFRSQMAVILQKQAHLHIQLRDHTLALKAVHAASSLLATQPNHPDQARLRLLLGRIRQLEGFHSQGLQALEEGLALLENEKSNESQLNRVQLLLELGQIQLRKCQFQRAMETLHSAQRILESHQNLSRLSDVHRHLGMAGMALGQPDMALAQIRDALQAAQKADDMECLAQCHLAIGLFRSQEQNVQPALRHLDSAQATFTHLVDKVGIARVRVWKARTWSLLGENDQAQRELEEGLNIPPERLTALERGDLAYLQAEIANDRNDPKEAMRLYWMAADIFEGAGHAWFEMLSRLRYIHAVALLASITGDDQDLESAWTLLENHKGRIEGSGSRWLEMEWHRAHGRLLSSLPSPKESIATECLFAWGEVQRLAGELRFHANILEACTQNAAVLIQRREKLGVKSRIQEAFSAFQELWSRVPENSGFSFLDRPDILRFRTLVERAGQNFVLPERVNTLAEWTPTRVSLNVATSSLESL